MASLGERLKRALHGHGATIGVVAIVPVVFVLGGLVVPGFTSRADVLSLLVLGSLLGIASTGQTLAIILGGIDLSIPAVIGMADVLTAILYGNGLPFWEVAAVVLTLAISIGVVNGVISRTLRAHPLIVTLASGSVVTGAVLVFTQAQTSGAVPQWLTNSVAPISHTGLIPVPPVVVVWGVLAGAIIGFQRLTWVGRFMYAFGANPVAGRLARIPVGPLWAMTYGLSSMFAAVAGIFLAGFSGGADVGVGDSYLFLTVAAVVVGGTSLLGGRGGYGRTVVGALVITEVSTLLIGLGYNDFVQEMVLGPAIVMAVWLYGREQPISRQI